MKQEKKKIMVGLTGIFKLQPKDNRKHYELKDGDMVRYKLKPSIGTKGHEPKWSSTRNKIVVNSTNNEYVIPSVAVEHRKYKLWLRHYLLNV